MKGYDISLEGCYSFHLLPNNNASLSLFYSRVAQGKNKKLKEKESIIWYSSIFLCFYFLLSSYLLSLSLSIFPLFLLPFGAFGERKKEK